MKKTASLLFLLFATITQLFSQAPKSSLLWAISGNDLQKPSYIFGTFHIMCKEDFSISPILKSKLRATKQFYGELKMDDPSMQQQLALKMAMKGQTMQSLLDAKEYKEVSDSFQRITGLPFMLFNNFKPFMTLSVLTIKSISCSDIVQPETEFVSLAKENKLPILGLETIDDEMHAIDKQPLDSQVNSLKQMILNFDSIKTETKKMIAVYNKRNIDSIYRFASGSGMDGNFERDFVITRNKNWMPVIKKAMKEKETFFAVGAGHLGGKEGLLNLLRTQGYKVTPVKF
ncbi:MAG: TraB/GumN family protein [Bacteroidota bacterium]